MRAGLAIGLVATGLLSGCTFGPGTGFTTLRAVSVAAEVGEDTETDLGAQVVWEQASFGVAEVALMELSGGGGTFDPANPPAEFTLCHNGHCHHIDGDLWSYDEIEAYLAGDSATFTDIAVVALDGVLDSSADALEAAADQDLPLSSIVRLELRATDVVLVGRITPAGANEAADVEVDLVLEEPLVASVDLPIDRDQESVIDVWITVPVDADVLDGVDAAARLEADGELFIDAEHPDADTVLGNLAQLEPVVEVTP